MSEGRETRVDASRTDLEARRDELRAICSVPPFDGWLAMLMKGSMCVHGSWRSAGHTVSYYANLLI